jgi:hypothetical protein
VGVKRPCDSGGNASKYASKLEGTKQIGNEI